MVPGGQRHTGWRRMTEQEEPGPQILGQGEEGLEGGGSHDTGRVGLEVGGLQV